MSGTNGHDPGDFPGRPDNWPSRDLGSPGEERGGCFGLFAVVLLAPPLIAAAIAEVWRVVA